MLDLTKFKKNYFDIKLPNGILLNVNTPTKSVYSSIINIQNEMSVKSEIEVIADLYDLISVILSNNKQKKIISTQDVEEMLDFNMVQQILESYVGFITGVLNSPN